MRCGAAVPADSLGAAASDETGRDATRRDVGMHFWASKHFLAFFVFLHLALILQHFFAYLAKKFRRLRRRLLT